MTDRETVCNLGEFSLIAQIKKMAPPLSAEVCAGIGDDAAVIRQVDGSVLLVTTDMLVEGTHFSLATTSATDLGYKSLAVNLSDIGAMGGIPSHYFLVLGLPSTCLFGWFQDFLTGMFSLARHEGVQLLGGDTVAAKQLTICITLHGQAQEAAVAYRRGAKPGDDLYVSGSLGDSALGLALLQQRESCCHPLAAKGVPVGGEAAKFLISRHRRPEPRLQLGRLLTERRLISAMLDISDGLLGDLGHLLSAEESSLGADIMVDQVPLSWAYRAHQLSDSLAAYRPALTGGEDYELLFTAPAGRERVFSRLAKETGVPLARVGSISREPGIRLYLPGGEIVDGAHLHGFDHFAGQR
ncbi:MAG: thiamine-phosphate kinase [Deltaproteobacteria bacterium]|nr:thiamine-phosphate kinase [Candidatus Anaeroferrophillus wilburensis]MBN2888849.1 thiamine-phosphate kinase [Deltaproteobacteria bacterium]